MSCLCPNICESTSTVSCGDSRHRGVLVQHQTRISGQATIKVSASARGVPPSASRNILGLLLPARPVVVTSTQLVWQCVGSIQQVTTCEQGQQARWCWLDCYHSLLRRTRSFTRNEYSYECYSSTLMTTTPSPGMDGYMSLFICRSSAEPPLNIYFIQ